MLPHRLRSVRAALGLGFTDEALGFGMWLRDAMEQNAEADGPPLRLMYRVDGSSDLDEEVLDHFEGYRLSAGPHRERRCRPAPTRHLRRGDGLDPRRRPGDCGHRRSRMERHRRNDRLA